MKSSQQHLAYFIKAYNSMFLDDFINAGVRMVKPVGTGPLSRSILVLLKYVPPELPKVTNIMAVSNNSLRKKRRNTVIFYVEEHSMEPSDKKDLS